MPSTSEFELAGHAGTLHAQRWQGDVPPRYVVLLVHGYGEHIGRYDWVARRLVRDGAVVYGLDLVGHGNSQGERVLIDDFDKVVDDVHVLATHVDEEQPELPVVLIGHSMGGMIAARYAQLHREDLTCVILSGPLLGSWTAGEELLALDEIPDTPIDPSVLSRDESVGEAYVNDPLVWHGPFKRQSLEAIMACLDKIEHGPPLENLPVLWLHGSADRLVPMKETQSGWRAIADEADASQCYPGARHEIFNETNRHEVLDDVIEFANRHRGGAEA